MKFKKLVLLAMFVGLKVNAFEVVHFKYDVFFRSCELMVDTNDYFCSQESGSPTTPVAVELNQVGGWPFQIFYGSTDIVKSYATKFGNIPVNVVNRISFQVSKMTSKYTLKVYSKVFKLGDAEPSKMVVLASVEAEGLPRPNSPNDIDLKVERFKAYMSPVIYEGLVPDRPMGTISSYVEMFKP